MNLDKYHKYEKKISRYFRLCFFYTAFSLKREATLPPIVTVLNILGRFGVQLASLGFLWVLFGKIASLGNWTLEGVAFIFGVQSLCAGFTEFFIGDLWWNSNRLMPGGLDTVLASPLSPLFQVINMGAGSGNVKAPGVAILGLAIIIKVAPGLGISWHFLQILYLLIMLIAGMFIYFGLSLMIISTTFWTKEPAGPPGISEIVTQFSSFARYPLNIYHPAFRMILTWFVPLAFTGFYPAVFYLSRGSYRPLVYLGPLVALVCMALGYFLWSRGLRRYETGH